MRSWWTYGRINHRPSNASRWMCFSSSGAGISLKTLRDVLSLRECVFKSRTNNQIGIDFSVWGCPVFEKGFITQFDAAGTPWCDLPTFIRPSSQLSACHPCLRGSGTRLQRPPHSRLLRPITEGQGHLIWYTPTNLAFYRPVSLACLDVQWWC